MFDRLFTRASAVAHHTRAAYAEERARYPQSCERRGDSGSTVLCKAHDLLWMHVLPQGFRRIRYYGLLTSPTRANNVARIRALLAVGLIPIDAIKAVTRKPEELKGPEHPCPCCGSHMRIIETFLPHNSQSTARPHFRRRSGSTPHDDILGAIANAVLDRRCARRPWKYAVGAEECSAARVEQKNETITP
jgi:hypothetical protein